MKLSIVIPVLDSCEIVRRQLLHFQHVGMPDDTELIIVDDGSDPPLAPYFEGQYGARLPVKFVETQDKRPWTQPRARNIGAQHAAGDILIFTDIDHILPRASLDWAKELAYDYAKFKRQLGVLDENGILTQDRQVLAAYGVPSTRGLRVSCHTLSMVVRKDVFGAVGGYRERVGKHPTHDDGNMKRKLKAIGAKKCPDTQREWIYVFPNGRFCGDKDANPFGLFHALERK